MNTYTLYRQDSKYFLDNISEDLVLTIKVSKKSCDSNPWKEIFTTEVQPNSTVQLEGTKEGFFKVTVDFVEIDPDPLNPQVFETEFKYFKDYYTSVSNLVEDLERIFCRKEDKSPCNNCPEEWDNCNMLLTASAKMEVIKRLHYPNLSPYLNATYALTNCFTKTLVDCHQEGELLHGKYQSPEYIISKLLALDYIALYLYYKAYNENELLPGLEEVNTIFNFEDIICCIEKNFGILLSEIQVPMATFTINIQVPINLPPSVVGNFVLNVTTEVESYILTSAMFTTGTTPPYEDPENDPPFKVRFDTLPTNGVVVFDGIPIVEGLEVLISDIEAEKLVYFTDPLLEQDTTIDFQFSVSDTGSEQFTS